MIKKWILMSKKLLALLAATIVAAATPLVETFALTSAEIFERIPASDTLPEHSEFNSWDLYSNIYSIKQCDVPQWIATHREFCTAKGEIVNATKIWKGTDLGTAIATQSPGGLVRNCREMFPRFLYLLAEVNEPVVVVLGPVEGCSCRFESGSILDYFTYGGISRLQEEKIPGADGLSSWLDVPRVEGVDQHILRVKVGGVDKAVPLTHFSDWADRKIPSSDLAKDNLEKLICSFRDGDDRDRDSTLIVHCSAGVGRTGVFLACLYALKTGLKNPVDIVKYLREYRTNMVQMPEQFDYICKFILRNLCGMRDLPWNTELTDKHFACMGITV